MDPPWIPEESSLPDDFELFKPDESTIIPVYSSQENIPIIDGNFSEWLGLDGALTRLAVYGGNHQPDDAEGFFVLRTDGTNLFVYIRVTDDLTHENYLPGSMAWRSDTPEFFFGSNTTKHKKYQRGDNQVRLVPRSKTNSTDVDIVINQRTVGAYMVQGEDGAIFGASAVYFDGGYEIEASIPLSLMMIESLSLNQKVRCDFQVNDADETERDRMVHWMSEKDTPWFDPSVWGNGQVVALPSERKEAGNAL
ncbi:MAG: CBM9 family sugar-binding protein [Spirochaetales bacterium]|nr:CBM9 family sugar-binding protein [Spirochaetales bacterium]